METQELNHKATARQKERPERWVGWYELPQPPLNMGAEHVYWYGDQGGRNKEGGYTGPGGLWKCYRKWENMSMNQLQEWKQSQNGFGFVTVSSGNIAVGGLWLQEARKWTQTFLSSPNCCWCKSKRNNHPCGGLNKSESRLQRTVNNKGTLVSMCSCQM